MKTDSASPSRVQRVIVAALGSAAAALTILWMVENNLVQVFLILGSLGLVLEMILVAAAWRHGFRWFLSRHSLRFYVWLAIGLVSVVALYYAEESWRGRRAWSVLLRELEARNESVKMESVAPPAVPEEQNFALAPGMERFMTHSAFDLGARRERPGGGWSIQQTTDLAAWQDFFRDQATTNANASRDGKDSPQFTVPSEPGNPAADVLLALSPYTNLVEILRAAGQRDQARFPIDYTQGIFALRGSNWAFQENLRSATHLLSLRASAHLALGQIDAAFRDTQLALRLAETLRQEPFGATYHLRTEMIAYCLQPIWEGLAMRRWTESQLAAMQAQLGSMDMLQDFRNVSRGETLATINFIDQFHAVIPKRGSSLTRELAGVGSSEWFWIWLVRAFYPVGWLYQDRAWLYRYYEQRADPMKALALANAPDWKLRANFRRISDPMMLVFVVPRFREVFVDGTEKALFLHIALRQAGLACALERYRAARKHYPESLAELTPAYLDRIPPDILDPSGDEMKYLRTDDGGFLLYSVGLNRIDDSGSPSPAHRDWRGIPYLFPRLEAGDWVWSKPS